MQVIAWLVVAILLAVGEAATGALYAAFLALGAVGGLAAAAFDLPLVVQAVVFLAVSVGGVLGVRPRLVRRRSARLVSGAQAMIGETAVVQDRIEGTVPGHVRLGGEQWLAITGEGISLEPGTDVMVVDIEGTKLVVARR